MKISAIAVSSISSQVTENRIHGNPAAKTVVFDVPAGLKLPAGLDSLNVPQVIEKKEYGNPAEVYLGFAGLPKTVQSGRGPLSYKRGTDGLMGELTNGGTMQTITATEKITTRMRPVALRPAKPTTEVLTSHSAVCPECSRETRVGIGTTATVYGGCAHFMGVQQRGAEISIMFGKVAA